MRTISNVIFYAAWIVHGAVLAFADITAMTWQFWALTLAMGLAVFFNPVNWRD